MITEQRRDPESLLKALKKREPTKKRGQLRVFLGMCPGVGKTYGMLKAAQETINSGGRVVVGLVETHGRKETEVLLSGIQIQPLKEIEYRGAVFKELDLDALLKLDPKPDLVLVDELAHQNVSGARHLKRYQDVEELLSHGFNVYTTVNIQHVESRNDQVAQITGVVMRETVPDSFFDRADEIEMIDLSPPELLKRLAEGKVYLGERAERALENFFQEEKLTALRELALRFTAERVDQDLAQQMTLKGIAGPWNINERFLVAVGVSPYSSRLIRAARRMAYSLDAPWIALYVDTGGNLSREDRKNLEFNLNLAKELGAEMVTVANVNITRAIQKVCEDRNVTQVVMGRPDRRFFIDLITGGTLLERLVSSTSAVDIHVLRAERRPRYRRFRFSWPKFSTKFSTYLLTALLTIGVSAFFYAILPYVGYRSLGSGFLLVLLILAAFARRGPTIFAAFAFAFIWYFFFITPRFTLQANEWQDFMMVASFLVTGTVAGWLTSRIRYQEELMARRESRTALLYEFTKKVNTANKIDDIVKILNNTTEALLDSKSWTVIANNNGQLDFDNIKADISPKDLAVASWTFTHGTRAGRFTNTLSGATCFCYSLIDESESVGVLIVMPSQSLTSLGAEEDFLLNSLTRQAASSIHKIELEEAAQKSSLLAATERLHQRILNSLFSKLSAPISKILVLANELKNCSPDLAGPQEELAELARQLSQVAANVSNLTDLESDKSDLQLEKFNLSDLFEKILTALPSEARERIALNYSKDIALIADYRLLENALGNLIDNSVRYATGKIDIDFYETDTSIKIKIKDEGPGIPTGEEETIFEKFYRGPADKIGVGLGLAIAKKVFNLHGGEVTAQNLAQGALLEVTLPLKKPDLN